jgi:predicted nucleotide-binding protein
MAEGDLTIGQKQLLKWIIHEVRSQRLPEADIRFNFTLGNSDGPVIENYGGNPSDIPTHVLSKQVLQRFHQLKLIDLSTTIGSGKQIERCTLRQKAYDVADNLTENSKEAQSDSMVAPTNISHDTSTVFVVHGRNEPLRRSVFAFLRALSLQPLEWSEAVKLTGAGAPYIGQILDRAFTVAQAVVVVLSPDDIAMLQPYLASDSDPPHEREPTGQPRPNVLFEAGMALGRNPDRTILVEIVSSRPFSDIAGRHVVRLDNSPERRHALLDRLRTAGCAVSTSGTDWLGEGDFTVGVQV